MLKNYFILDGNQSVDIWDFVLLKIGFRKFANQLTFNL